MIHISRAIDSILSRIFRRPVERPDKVPVIDHGKCEICGAPACITRASLGRDLVDERFTPYEIRLCADCLREDFGYSEGE